MENWNKLLDRIIELEDLSAKETYYLEFELYENGFTDISTKNVNGKKLA